MIEKIKKYSHLFPAFFLFLTIAVSFPLTFKTLDLRNRAFQDTTQNCEIVSYSPLDFRKKKNEKATVENLRSSNQLIYKQRNLTQTSKKTTLNQRKKYLVESFFETPAEAIKYVVSENQISQPDNGCIEKFVTKEGILKVLHGENFDNKTTATQYILKTSDKEINLSFTGAPKEPLVSGVNLKTSGYLIDNYMLIDNQQAGSINVTSSNNVYRKTDQLLYQSTGDTLGTQRLLTVLVYPIEQPVPNITKEYVYDLLIKSNSYFKEVSYDKASLSHATYGWYGIPISDPYNLNGLQAEAIKAVDSEVNFNDFDRLLIIFPGGSLGYGSLGRYPITTQDGTVNLSVSWVYTGTFTLEEGHGVINHELGHNFGVHHANYLQCSTVNIDSPSCSSAEYGDYFDVMGAYVIGHMNAGHKYYLGWLDSNEIYLLNEKGSGTYSINPIEKKDGVKALVLKRSAYSDQNIFLEFRQPIGEDIKLEAVNRNIFDGALIHKGQFHTNLFDTTPDANEWDWNRPALLPGNTFSEDITSSSFKVLEKTPEKITIESILGRNVDYTPPSISITAPQSNQIMSGNFRVKATVEDDSPIEYVSFYLDRLEFVFSNPQSSTLEFDIDTTKVINGYLNLYAFVRDINGNYNSLTIPVRIENSDSLPPTLSVTAPLEGQALLNPISFSANASDNIGVNKVEVWRNSEQYPFYIFYQPPYEFRTMGYNDFPDGNNLLIVKAVDFVGNVTQKNINFFVGINPPSPTPTITPSPTPTKTPTPTPSKTPTPTPGAKITIDLSADSYVRKLTPKTNYGTATNLKVMGGSDLAQSYLKVSLVSVNKDKVKSAKLKFKIADTSIGIYNIVFVTKNGWNENKINYNNRPVSGALITTFTPVSAQSYQEVDITSIVKEKAGGILSLMINSTSTDELSIYSRNSVYPPTLEVTE